MIKQLFAVILNTQYWENYGAHTWDGEGKCPQYWKPKFGSAFWVATVEARSAEDALGLSFFKVARKEKDIVQDDDYGREEVLSMEVLSVNDAEIRESFNRMHYFEIDQIVEACPSLHWAAVVETEGCREVIRHQAPKVEGFKLGDLLSQEVV